MIFRMWEDPTNLDRHFHLVITDKDRIEANRDILLRGSQVLTYFNRAGASIEEQLMGLQILVRAIEEGNEKTSQVS